MNPSENPPFPTPPSLLRADHSIRPLRSREALHRIRREAAQPHSGSLPKQASRRGGTDRLGELTGGSVEFAIAEPCWKEAIGKLWRRKWAVRREVNAEWKGKARIAGKMMGRQIAAWSCHSRNDESSGRFNWEQIGATRRMASKTYEEMEQCLIAPLMSPSWNSRRDSMELSSWTWNERVRRTVNTALGSKKSRTAFFHCFWSK